MTKLQTVADAKSRAKALRSALAAMGTPITHTRALELVAHENGARDWNTLQAKLSRVTLKPFTLNTTVTGRYMGQPFSGRIMALAKAGANTQISIQLDEPVDTVRFESFSNLRRHIRGVVDPNGRSPRRTSDDKPHLFLDLPGD